jgi:nucleotidyltransferase/DNA polymerase involved in DNA repair
MISMRRVEPMTNTRDDGRLVRYSFTIDFAEPDVESYPIDELAADAVDVDREAIKASLLDAHTDAIQRAAERIRVLIQSDTTLDSILNAHDIGLVMGLSH